MLAVLPRARAQPPKDHWRTAPMKLLRLIMKGFIIAFSVGSACRF